MTKKERDVETSLGIHMRTTVLKLLVTHLAQVPDPSPDVAPDVSDQP